MSFFDVPDNLMPMPEDDTDWEEREDQALRCWCVDQASKIHGYGSGAMDVLSTATAYYKWIKNEDSPKTQ